MNECIDRTDLLFSTVGLVLIGAVPMLMAPAGRFWAVMAVIATIVALFHSLIFWVVYLRQKYVSDHLVQEVRKVLKDEVHDKLPAVSMESDCEQERAVCEQIHEIRSLVDDMSLRVSTLTSEAIEDRKRTYRKSRTGDESGAAGIRPPAETTVPSEVQRLGSRRRLS